jgi:type II secretory pathway pseudopilin PulG
MKPRDRIAVAAVAVVVAVVAFFFVALKPKLHERSQLGTQITAQEQRLSQAQSTLARYRADRAHYRQNFATVTRLGKAVPAGTQVPSLLVQLGSTSHHDDVGFRSVQVTPPSSDASAATTADSTAASAAGAPAGSAVGSGGVQTMPFSFTFEGSFFRLADFLGSLADYVGVQGNRIDVGGRLLTIDGFQFGAGDNGFPHIQATISATGFVAPGSAGVASVSSTAAVSPSTPTSATP